MKNFIVYNNLGEILRTGSCPDNSFNLQAGDNESIIEGLVSDDTNYRVIDGEIIYQPAPIETSEVLYELRIQRDLMLKSTDWTQIPDAPLTDEKKAQYRAYRQALRDLPSKYDTITDIAEVNFPTLEDY